MDYRSTPITEKQIEQAQRIVKAFHSTDTTGHDWWHVQRVTHLARFIALKEGANPEMVELASLLHDMDDHKLGHDNYDQLPNARRVLHELGVTPELETVVAKIISEISYKGAEVDTTPTTLEACIVQDADRLDAIGAIGIGRAFAYGGAKSREMHNPESAPKQHASFQEYKSSTGTTINHFYEKLLLLKDRMNTPTAKSIAEHRHNLMERFVEQFLDEWNGCDIV